jgi:RNA polymerase sigma-70 factor (ECF subfamily)
MQEKKFLDTILPIKDKLYRLAKRILVSNDEAEDAVQEVFLKLWNGRDKMNNYKNPEAFAMTMTKNYCLDRLKSKQASNLTIVHNNYQNSENVQKKVEVKEEVEIVFELMKDLPEKQKIIMQMRDVEQYEFSEISQILDINETAIRVSLSRARKTIREQLMKQINYGIN